MGPDILLAIKQEVIPVTAGPNKTSSDLLTTGQAGILKESYRRLHALLGEQKIKPREFNGLEYKFRPYIYSESNNASGNPLTPLAMFMGAIYNFTLAINRGEVRGEGVVQEEVDRVRVEAVSGLTGLLGSINEISLSNIHLGNFQVRTNQNGEQQGVVNTEMELGLLGRPFIEAIYNPRRKRFGIGYNERHPAKPVGLGVPDHTIGASATILSDRLDEETGVLKLELAVHRRRWTVVEEGRLVSDRLEEHIIDTMLGSGRKMILLARGNYRETLEWERILMNQLHVSQQLLPRN